MADTSNDFNQPILNLTAEEKRAFATLFAQADKEQLGVITGETAVSFFERTRVSPNVLGEIWQIADTENRGLLTKPGFCIVLRLIGHYQAGRNPTPELAFKPAPIPKFDGGPPGGPIPSALAPSSPVGPSGLPQAALQPQQSGSGPIRVPPLDPQKVQQFSALFDRSGPQNGILDRFTAKAIFERAGLPNEVLGHIWNLADREQKGALDQTEFIIAMHLLTSMKNRTMTALPTVLPPGLYEAAARRGAPLPARPVPGVAAIPRQLTGSSVGTVPRTQSPLARAPAYVNPTGPVLGSNWLVTPAEKAKYDQFFANLDVEGRGVISGEQAVSFFSDSRLPEDTLAQIWDLADINSAGQLNRDEFAVAMYLIRQQKAPNAGPLPAFLPSALIPPSLRKQQPQASTTAQPSNGTPFDASSSSVNLPKSAADDLFGLDQPSSPPATAALQPTNTGSSALKDPFVGNSYPASPGSPSRAPPAAQGGSSVFKPFMPTSAFGASLAQQPTGGSTAPVQAAVNRSLPATNQFATNASDDLLGDNETHAQESSKLTSEATELANMSNQIGNLRTQMEQTQAKKSVAQSELAATSTQKRDLETRLQQFRAQYEQEVRTVKDLEQQLSASRGATQKLNQELAMVEGSYQDLQNQHQTIAQALQADQQENAALKSRIAQLNAEVARLKPEIEKMKLDARQQKGLVSINKKQLSTSESERDRLQSEKDDLERASQARSLDEARETAISPAPSLSATNPFARKAGSAAALDRSQSPLMSSAVPTPTAFDELFGPSSAFAPSGQTIAGTATPPPTSFIGRTLPATTDTSPGMAGSVQSISTAGEPTPSATPPLEKTAEITPGPGPGPSSPPPPPEGRQFTASQLPIVNLAHKSHDSETRSTNVVPPASRAGDVGTPSAVSAAQTPSFQGVQTTAADDIPGAFPSESISSSANDDFDAAFAGFDHHDSSATRAPEVQPFGSSPYQAHSSTVVSGGAAPEFPPIQSLELDDDDEDSDDEGQHAFGDSLTNSSGQGAGSVAEHQASLPASEHMLKSVQPAHSPPDADAQPSPPTYESTEDPHKGSENFPAEFDGLLPSREDPTAAPHVEEATPVASPSSHAVHSLGPDMSSATHLPVDTGTPLSPPSRSNTADIFHDASSRPLSSATEFAPVEIHSRPAANAFDEFDDFEDLAEAKEADKNGSDDIDFGFDKNEANEFNPAFDSPAASMTNTMTSLQQTPATAPRTFAHGESGSFSQFASSSSAFGGLGNNASTEQTPQSAQHDWDAIFSGLDSSKPADMSLTTDPWSSAAASARPSQQTSEPEVSTAKTQSPFGRAITPGTEHDDPILKRLTGMGYPRKDALSALEKYDYDINRAVDHLSK